MEQLQNAWKEAILNGVVSMRYNMTRVVIVWPAMMEFVTSIQPPPFKDLELRRYKVTFTTSQQEIIT